MIRINEKNDFALVQRPPGALEKTEPGAKRVLSGMVADTLALAKKGTVRKSRPLRIVVVYDEDGPRKSLEFMLRHSFPDANLLLCQSSVEALEELSQSDDPDLLITGTWFPVIRGKEFVERVTDRKATYPIVVASAYEPEETWVREYARRGVNISFLPLPYTLESLRKAMEAAGFDIPRDTTEKPVAIAPQPRRTRPLRIVMMDDEPFVLNAAKLMIQSRFKDAEIRTFTDTEEALSELEREDPDLFTTDFAHPKIRGDELVRILAKRNVKYPIFVMSGYLGAIQGQNLFQDCLEQGMNISFLSKPFTKEELCSLMVKHLAPDDDPKFAKSEP